MSSCSHEKHSDPRALDPTWYCPRCGVCPTIPVEPLALVVKHVHPIVLDRILLEHLAMSLRTRDVQLMGHVSVCTSVSQTAPSQSEIPAHPHWAKVGREPAMRLRRYCRTHSGHLTSPFMSRKPSRMVNLSASSKRRSNDRITTK